MITTCTALVYNSAQTLQYHDSLDPRHFGTHAKVPVRQFGT